MLGKVFLDLGIGPRKLLKVLQQLLRPLQGMPHRQYHPQVLVSNDLSRRTIAFQIMFVCGSHSRYYFMFSSVRLVGTGKECFWKLL